MTGEHEHQQRPPIAAFDGPVLALVLTHDAPEMLGRCLDALGAQTRPLADVLVVDNASAQSVHDVVAARHGRVLRLDENVGPAGGYAAGLHAALESDAAWIWVMDDDCVPAPNALESLAATAIDELGPRVVLATAVDQETDEVISGIGWWGVLIPRVVVEVVGGPLPELFYWCEDSEYLQWRIPNAGFFVVPCPDAMVAVQHSRPRGEDRPAWKYYYQARNKLYYKWRLQLPSPRESGWPGVRSRVLRAYQGASGVSRLAALAIGREHDQRLHKLAMVGRGALDGCRGRLGITVPVDDADRPQAPDQASTR